MKRGQSDYLLEYINFYLWKLSINPKKQGSSKVGMLFFSQKIMNMFALVHLFGMQMVEFCENIVWSCR